MFNYIFLNKMLNIQCGRAKPGGRENRRILGRDFQTYKAVSVFRSWAASGTFSMTAVTDIGSVAPAITLFCTHCPCHCRRQKWGINQSRSPRETTKEIGSGWENLNSRVIYSTNRWLNSAKIFLIEVCNRSKLLYKILLN